VTVFWARYVHTWKSLRGVNFDFNDNAFESHHSAGVDAGKHWGSVDEEGENVNSREARNWLLNPGTKRSILIIG